MTSEVSAETANLSAFIERGETYLHNLQQVLGNVHRARFTALVNGLDHGPAQNHPSADASLKELISQAGYNNRFVSGIHDSLIGKSGVIALARSSDLRVAVLEGTVSFPDNNTRQRVVAAMAKGLSPIEAGLADVYFPLDYRTLFDLDGQLDALAMEREDADGSTWKLSFDDDTAWLADVDEQIESVRKDRAQLATAVGADRSNRVSDVAAIAAVGEWINDPTWEGDQHAAWVTRHLNGLTEHLEESPRPHLVGASDRAHISDGLSIIGERVATDPHRAVEFFNTLGPQTTAALPTLLTGSVPPGGNATHLDDLVEDFGQGLGEASRLEDNGTPLLSFTGDKLINTTPLTTQQTPFWYHPSVLFSSGSYSSQFLIDAASAALVNGQTPTPRAPQMITGDAVVGVGTWRRSGGEDPRNILVSRVAEDPALAAALVEQLRQRSPGLEPLLFSEAPFVPAYNGPHQSGEYHPNLNSDYPITAALIAAGTDDAAANTILNAPVFQPDLGFSDGGVAVGVDGIMAQHATIMYPPDVLAAAGITQTGINRFAGGGESEADSPAGGHPSWTGPNAGAITPDIWRHNLRLIMDHGQGAHLANATDILLDQAIIGTVVADSTFDAEAARAFAVIAGATNAEVVEAHFNYAATIDEINRRGNRIANLAASAAFAALGLVPVWGVGFSGAGVALTAIHEGLPTDNQLEAYREEYNKLVYVDQDRATVWANLIYDQLLQQAAEVGHLELVKLGTAETQHMTITTNGDTLQIQHPTTGAWIEPPALRSDRFGELFGGTQVDAIDNFGADMQHDYMNGVLLTFDDPDSVVDTDGTAGPETPTVGRRLATPSPERIEEAVRESEFLNLDDWLIDG